MLGRSGFGCGWKGDGGEHAPRADHVAHFLQTRRTQSFQHPQPVLVVPLQLYPSPSPLRVPPTETPIGTRTPITPAPLTTDEEADLQISAWFDAGRARPLDIHCTFSTFTSTLARLSATNKLPRLARDYDPTTQTWHLRSRPHTLHEIGNKVLNSLQTLLAPRLATGIFARLAPKIVWFRGSPTTELPGGGTKEPDAAMGMDGRRSPTIVIEAGYSETLEKLRLDARRWLTVAEPTAQKRKGGVVDGRKQRPVMLVILISFEGQQPSEAFPALDESSGEEEEELEAGGGGRKGLSVFVELWRNRSEPGWRETRNTDATVQPQPACCERKRFYPTPEDGQGNDYITLFATDLFGEKVVDPEGLQKWRVPLSVFGDAYALMLRTWEGAAEDANDDDEVVFVTEPSREERQGDEEYEQEGQEEDVAKRAKI